MKMTMLLLISTVAMLISSNAASPTRHKPKHNLSRIIELADNYSKSVTEEYYVEDVWHLAEGRCEDKFFCKVYEILRAHDKFGKRKVEEELVRNLKIYVDGRNPNCTVMLEGVPRSMDTRPIPKLMESLTKCIQSRNLSEA